MSINQHKSMMIALSGSSSAGKSTLLYLLSEIFSPVFTIQLDDFCKEFEFLPTRRGGGLDGDAVDSIDFEAFNKTLHYCREAEKMPDDFKSWQDPQDVNCAKETALGKVKLRLMEKMRKLAYEHFGKTRKFGIVDGFLLYLEPARVYDTPLHFKLFIRASKCTAFSRRMARPGYGDPKSKDFWRTPGYFEECVWGNYVKEHAWLFKDGDVEGEPDEEVCKREHILMQPKIDATIEETFEWAVKAIIGESKSCTPKS